MGSLLLEGAGPGGAGIDFTNWWLSGGVNSANCFAAFRGKGAASKAASYQNLNNPGTHDLYYLGLLDSAGAQTSEPAWNTASGWAMRGEQAYLAMNGTFKPTQAMSVLIQFTAADTVSMQFCGASEAITGGGGTRSNGISINNTGAFQDIYNWNPGGDLIGGTLTDGNYAIAGKTFYRNGTPSLTLGAGTGTNLYDWFWGCENWSGTSHGGGVHTLVAMACYTTTLTDQQVAAIAAKMALM